MRLSKSNNHCNPVTLTKFRYENNETSSLHSLFKFTHALGVTCVTCDTYVYVYMCKYSSYVRNILYMYAIYYGGELEANSRKRGIALLRADRNLERQKGTSSLIKLDCTV